VDGGKFSSPELLEDKRNGRVLFQRWQLDSLEDTVRYNLTHEDGNRSPSLLRKHASGFMPHFMGLLVPYFAARLK
jgi:hypothetical protein